MIIGMTGLPGTGKSAIAQQLAVQLPAVVLDKDRIRAALFAPALIEYSAAQDDFCMDVMLQTAAYHLARERSTHIIIDGRTFSRHYQVELLRRFADQHGVDLKLIYCICSDATVQRRLLHDQQSGTHPATNRTWALYQQVKQHWEPIAEPKLTIDTDQPLDSCVQSCMSYLTSH